MDFLYSKKDGLKLIEANADTPSILLESGKHILIYNNLDDNSNKNIKHEIIIIKCIFLNFFKY